MPLQKSNAVFPLVQGIDTKTDKKQLVTGKMELLENVTLISPGQYQKRNGYESLDSVTNPQGMGVLNEELVLFANNNVLTYSPSADQAEVRKTGPASSTDLDYQALQVTTYRGISTFENTLMSDTAYHSSGLQAFVSYTSVPDLYFSIIDSQTNATTFNPKLVLAGTSTCGKVFVVGGFFIVVYYQSTDLKYVAVPINSTSSALPSAVTISSTVAAANPIFDACVLNDSLYIVWKMTAGVGVASLDSSLTLRVSALPTSDVVSKALTITQDEVQNLLWISYWDGTSLKYTIIDENFATAQMITVIEAVANVNTVVISVYNNDGYIYCEIAGSGLAAHCFYNNKIRRTTISSAVIGTPAVWIRSVGIASKPFRVTVSDEVITCILVGYTGNQPSPGTGTIFILNTNAVVIGKLAPGNCLGVTAGAQGLMNNSAPGEVNQVSDSQFVSSFCRANFGYSEGGIVYEADGAFGVTINFDSNYNYQSEVAANNLHVVGGVLGAYDGQEFVEHGFNIIAEPVTSATDSYDAVTTNFATGTYSYVIVFEWVDAQGSYHRSVPSAVFAYALVGPKTTVSLTVPNLRITQKENVFLSVYRNTLAAPTVFNRISAIPTSTQEGSTSTDSVFIDDSNPDSTVETHQLIYTTGDVVANYAVPSPRIVTGYKNRLMVLPAETPNIIWFSKTVLQGIPSIPVEFSALFTIQVNTLGGDITAFLQMDDKFIIFKEAKIFYMAGDGPSDNGANNDFTVPQAIATDCGCINSRSPVLTPNGIIYQSAKGIYLLDRSLGVSYIGAPVEAYNGDTILSSRIIPNTTQVRFLLDSGVALVFDYFVGQWFVYTRHSGVDAVIYNDLYTYLGSDGNILQETLLEYSDNGSFITQTLKTGWLSFAGIQGFQRIFKMEMLGEYKSPHQVLVSFAFDFNPNIFQTVLFDVGTLYDNGVYGDDPTYGDSSPYGGDNGYPQDQFTLYPIIQRCESIQVTIQDVQTTEIGASYALSSLGFEVGVEGGLNRQRAAQKFG